MGTPQQSFFPRNHQFAMSGRCSLAPSPWIHRSHPRRCKFPHDQTTPFLHCFGFGLLAVVLVIVGWPGVIGDGEAQAGSNQGFLCGQRYKLCGQPLQAACGGSALISFLRSAVPCTISAPRQHQKLLSICAHVAQAWYFRLR